MINLTEKLSEVSTVRLHASIIINSWMAQMAGTALGYLVAARTLEPCCQAGRASGELARLDTLTSNTVKGKCSVSRAYSCGS